MQGQLTDLSRQKADADERVKGYEEKLETVETGAAGGGRRACAHRRARNRHGCAHPGHDGPRPQAEGAGNGVVRGKRWKGPARRRDRRPGRRCSGAAPAVRVRPGEPGRIPRCERAAGRGAEAGEGERGAHGPARGCGRRARAQDARLEQTLKELEKELYQERMSAAGSRPSSRRAKPRCRRSTNHRPAEGRARPQSKPPAGPRRRPSPAPTGPAGPGPSHPLPNRRRRPRRLTPERPTAAGPDPATSSTSSCAKKAQ